MFRNITNAIPAIYFYFMSQFPEKQLTGRCTPSFDIPLWLSFCEIQQIMHICQEFGNTEHMSMEWSCKENYKTLVVMLVKRCSFVMSFMKQRLIELNFMKCKEYCINDNLKWNYKMFKQNVNISYSSQVNTQTKFNDFDKGEKVIILRGRRDPGSLPARITSMCKHNKQLYILFM